VPDIADRGQIDQLAERLEQSIDESGYFVTVDHSKTGLIEVEQFRPRCAKAVIDDIDRLLARYYGMTDGELDFIVNYDVKYRMGRGAEEAED